MSNRPSIPEGMKRELRKEAYFGCAKCGCPVIEYHHIEPWSKVKRHEKDNLVALCPICHHEANTGAIYPEKVREYKEKPINKALRFVQKDFWLRDFENVTLKFGKTRFKNTKEILEVFGCKLIYFNIGEDGVALLNAVFFDEGMRIIATITDNEWKTYIYDDMWDIQYSPGHLKINLKRNHIFLELRAKGNEVTIKASLNVFGNRIIANESGIKINDTTLEIGEIVGAQKGIVIG